MKLHCSLADLARTPFRLLGSIGTHLGVVARPPEGEWPAEARASIEQLVVVHERTNELLGLLATVADQRAGDLSGGVAPAAPHEVLERLAELSVAQNETQALLARFLVVQQRTNDLLELALRAGFEDDDDEPARRRR